MASPPTFAGSTQKPSRPQVRLSLPDSPQRSEPQTAHDLYDEREKERRADATIERQNTAERGGERLLKRIRGSSYWCRCECLPSSVVRASSWS